jgi:type IV pilus assembly protein PilV
MLIMNIKKTFTHLHKQLGGLIIESLIAMMIFTIGIVGLLNLQTFATKAAADATYRSEAALLADQFISQAWSSDRSNPDTTVFQNNFSSPDGSNYQNWAWRGTNDDGTNGSGTLTNPAPGTVYALLPGASANPPTVDITPILSTSPLCTPSCPSSYRVVVTVFWQAPSDNDRNNHVSEAHIGGGQ